MNKANDIAKAYSLYVNDLFTYGTYLGFEKEIVKDAIHDVFCKLVNDKTELHKLQSIKYYLFKSLKNILIDLHKYKKDHITIDNINPGELPFNININVEDLLIEREEQLVIKSEIEQMLNALTDRNEKLFIFDMFKNMIMNKSRSFCRSAFTVATSWCQKLLLAYVKNLVP